MSTTLLYVEILIIGILASVWISLSVFSTVGPPPTDAVGFPELHPAILATAYLACCYALGIVIDRIADFAFSFTKIAERVLDIRCIKRICDSVSEHGNETVRFQVAIKESRATDSLDYLRSRLRISRATTVNAVPLLLATIVSLWKSGTLESPCKWFLVVGVGLAFILASFSTSIMLENSYILARERIVVGIGNLERALSANGIPERTDPLPDEERDHALPNR